MKRALIVILGALATSSAANAAGHAYNENFSVLTPAQPSDEEAKAFAEKVLRQADHYRKLLAAEWLGEELPAGAGRTIINVSFTDKDTALTWPIDNHRRKCHMLYLSTSPERAVGSALKHEMIHVIMATQFGQGKRLPIWIEEGIASRYDDQTRIARRRAIINWYARTGQWPDLADVLGRQKISRRDASAYSVAASVTDYLLSRGDRQTVVKFGQEVTSTDIQTALRKHYKIRSVGDLQIAWKNWVRRHAQLAVK